VDVEVIKIMFDSHSWFDKLNLGCSFKDFVFSVGWFRSLAFAETAVTEWSTDLGYFSKI
jgi:hypothetical protein